MEKTTTIKRLIQNVKSSWQHKWEIKGNFGQKVGRACIFFIHLLVFCCGYMIAAEFLWLRSIQKYHTFVHIVQRDARSRDVIIIYNQKEQKHKEKNSIEIFQKRKRKQRKWNMRKNLIRNKYIINYSDRTVLGLETKKRNNKSISFNGQRAAYIIFS